MVEPIREPLESRVDRTPRGREAIVEPVPPPVGARANDDVIDLRHLFAALWRGKWLILGLALLGALSGFQDVRGFSPRYVATMVVNPGPTSAGGPFPVQLGRVSSIASAVGVTIAGAPRGTAFDRLVLIMSSVTLAKRLQEKYGFLQKIYMGSWDPEAKRWIPPSGRRFEWRQKIRKFFNLSTWSEPNIESLARYLGGAIRIEDVENTGFKGLSVTHRDPDFALELLRTAYTEADNLMREQDRAETAQRKVYLESEFQQASLTEMRQALLTLLTNEERTAMLLNLSLPYAARMVEPPFVSGKQTEPNVLRLVGLPAFLGVVGGTLLVILIAVFRRESGR